MAVVIIVFCTVASVMAVIDDKNFTLFVQVAYFPTVAFAPCAYYFIFLDHVTAPMEGYKVIGFIDDGGCVDSTSGTPLTPPRVMYSKFSITMSYLKVNLYLAVLGAAVSGIQYLRAKHMGYSEASIILPIILFGVGFFLYTSQVFNYRTNLLLTVGALLYYFALIVFHTIGTGYFIHFFFLGCMVLYVSYHFLRYSGGNATISTVIESYSGSYSLIANTAVTGTRLDIRS